MLSCVYKKKERMKPFLNISKTLRHVLINNPKAMRLSVIAFV